MTIREDIVRIIQDPYVVTVTALVKYVEAQRADEKHKADLAISFWAEEVKNLKRRND